MWNKFYKWVLDDYGIDLIEVWKLIVKFFKDYRTQTVLIISFLIPSSIIYVWAVFLFTIAYPYAMLVYFLLALLGIICAFKYYVDGKLI